MQTRAAVDAAPKRSVAVARRLLDHLANGGTDQASEPYRVPVRNYLDAERWRLEVERVFKQKPVVLGLSCELPEPLSYKALTVAGVPVLLTRGPGGEVRAHVNVCRHRGAQVAGPGCGQAARFSCPYHGWTYDNAGRLLSVSDGRTFGPVDRSSRGLVALPAAERAGLIFGVLTPGATLDLDTWLGAYLDELESLEFGRWHVFSRWEMPGPNWKIAKEGYLESYHFAALHPKSINAFVHSNVMAVDAWGPHQRIVFPTRSITSLLDLPESDWNPEDHMAPVHAIFPNTAISPAWARRALVSQIFPGVTPGTSTTLQTLITRDPVETDEEHHAAQTESDFYLRVVRDEDYKTTLDVQQGLASGANEDLLFGRNELALHHFHRSLDQLVLGD